MMIQTMMMILIAWSEIMMIMIQIMMIMIQITNITCF